MDNPPPPQVVTYAAAGLATVVLILLSRRLFRRKLKLPPGPKPWPIIGNFNLMGKNYTLESEKGKVYTPHEFKKILDELFVLNGVLEIGDWIPWLSYFDLQGNVKRMKAVAKKIDRFMEHELQEHDARRAGVKNYVAKDMMDILLQLSEDPTLDVEFGRTGVKALTLVCFIDPFI
ncbi:unnamed protein product [Dovyalis caffra]|uniref:Cytochrome P450 n=1 Tax=Dovyalis caffra TaxID=77055 RepID=A0AAV1SR62_9ROSI|nr:unnamed protein product [Dovyalis caffra]